MIEEVSASAPELPCTELRMSFSGYLDGTITGREMQAVATHFESCAACAQDFATWRGMQQVLAAVGPVKAPAELGLKLRLAISHESSRLSGHWWDDLAVRWENLVRPVVVQFSAGLAGTLMLVGTIIMLVGVVAAPQAVLANDEPLGALTAPHYLYSAAPMLPVTTAEDTTIVVQADVDANGEVFNYVIVSGPNDPATETQVRDELMLLRYEPARVFGEPVRGRVLITFAGASVHG